MCLKLKRDHYCNICLTSNLNQRYKCLRCQKSLCAECSQETLEGIYHSRKHPMQLLLTNRRNSNFFNNRETLPYMMSSSFTCPICAQKGFHESSLVKHIEQEHKGNNELVFCPICIAKPYSSNASRVWSLWDHIRLHHLAFENEEPLLSSLRISEVDEKEEECFFSLDEDDDDTNFFNDLGVASDPASIGANNIFEEMAKDLLDYVEPFRTDALPNEISASEINFSTIVGTEFQQSSNAAQLANETFNAGNIADENLINEISREESARNENFSAALVNPHVVNQQAFENSYRFLSQRISASDFHATEASANRIVVSNYLANQRLDENFPSTNRLRAAGSSELRFNGYMHNAVEPRIVPSTVQLIRSNAEINNAADAGNVGNNPFVLPRLWPQNAQEQVTTAGAIVSTTEPMDISTENGSSNEPLEPNHNHL